jgi:hypothetical protein
MYIRIIVFMEAVFDDADVDRAHNHLLQFNYVGIYMYTSSKQVLCACASPLFLSWLTELLYLLF